MDLFLSVFIFLIILYMALEDYRFSTVDIRACFLLFLVISLKILMFTPDLKNEISYALKSVLVVFSLLASLRYLSSKIIYLRAGHTEEDDDIENHGLPFVPAFFIGYCVYFGYGKRILMLNWVDNFIIEVFFSSILFFACIFCIFIFAYLHHSKICRKQKSLTMKNINSEIIYGFNDGDVIFCSVITFYIGITDFYFVFISTMLLMFICFILNFLVGMKKGTNLVS